MADLCCMVGCNSVGTKFCGTCGEASYCSVGCQQEDWKVHKKSCINIGKLPFTFLLNPEVDKIYCKACAQSDILNLKRKDKEAINVLEKLLAFLEHQLGAQEEGTPYWKRSNGQLADNMALIHIRIKITKLHRKLDGSHLAFVTETRRMLEYRDKSNDLTLSQLADTEETLARTHIPSGMYSTAEHHCEQSLMFARLLKGEERITSEHTALKAFAQVFQSQNRFPEAIHYAEKAYIVLSEAYGPVHHQVQGMSAILISLLTANGDYSRADDYCRMNYDNLIDPSNGIDQDDILVAQGIFQLARIWLKKDPFVDEEAAFALAEEAEGMARKGFSIIEKLYSPDSIEVQMYSSELADVLKKRGKCAQGI